MRATNKFWNYLKNISEHVYWLNPVPYEFQNDCTARRLTFNIPMIYPDGNGLNSITEKSTNG